MSITPEQRWVGYFYPGTQTLINKRGERDDERLAKLECRIADVRLAELIECRGGLGNLDTAHWQAIHKHLLGDLYEWAGQLRDVNMSRGRSSFTDWEQLQDQAAELDARFAARGELRGLERSDFAAALAEHYVALNTLHPFRDGNGRATRVLLLAIADRAGYVLDLRKLARDPNAWNRASKLAHGGDAGAITAIFQDAIRPQRAVAFETMEREAAVRAHPELARFYERLELRRETLQADYPGNVQAEEHFLAHAKSEMGRELDRDLVELRVVQTVARAKHKLFMERARAFIAR